MNVTVPNRNFRANGILLCLPVIIAVLNLFGCGKPLLPEIPELPELIKRSSIIYVAEGRNGSYYVKQILKEPTEGQSLFIVGQAVILNRQQGGYKPKANTPVIVFFERKLIDENNKSHFIQWESPVSGEGTLPFFDANYDDVIKLIAQQKRQP